MENKSARKILSENLQSLMINKNVDQKELAEAIGVSQPTISNWLKETKYPRISKVEDMANYFNVPKSRITENQEIKSQDTIAAHFDKEDLTDEEKQEVQDFINYLKSKRK
ncbi:helix-turn-helix transcriptional regulator [Staphylococcus arlettae]|uniref:helix-turn-helix domain-containing protein n=1 Tax=Staphylococcus arlettae TaxID=29378 RepID=UPI0028A4D82B|nr:helix-turn-helix transcriptional regulator [Staphylococcus arlettae]MDT4050588.1 helix-turn-helix transcriptional regulator [Staphylococcus arlettae]